MRFNVFFKHENRLDMCAVKLQKLINLQYGMQHIATLGSKLFRFIKTHDTIFNHMVLINYFI